MDTIKKAMGISQNADPLMDVAVLGVIPQFVQMAPDGGTQYIAFTKDQLRERVRGLSSSDFKKQFNLLLQEKVIKPTHLQDHGEPTFRFSAKVVMPGQGRSGHHHGNPASRSTPMNQAPYPAPPSVPSDYPRSVFSGQFRPGSVAPSVGSDFPRSPVPGSVVSGQFRPGSVAPSVGSDFPRSPVPGSVVSGQFRPGSVAPSVGSDFPRSPVPGSVGSPRYGTSPVAPGFASPQYGTYQDFSRVSAMTSPRAGSVSSRPTSYLPPRSMAGSESVRSSTRGR